MLDSAQVVITQFIKRFTPSFQSSSNLDELEQIRLIDELVTNIVRTFFKPFLDHRFEKDELKEQALEEIRGRIDLGIVTYFATITVSSASAAILKTFHSSPKLSLPFGQLLSVLGAIFSSDEQKIKDLPKPLPSEIYHIVACIACAIQDCTIIAPITYYFGVAHMSEAARSTLIPVLEKIEVIRRFCTKANDLDTWRDVSQATRELNVQIARANNIIWLPLRSLVTAPLSSSDLTALYARGKDDVEKLAHQIVGGDGVFLITGYRGVGKSTLINEALAMLPEIQREQDDTEPWYVVPVAVSLAKSSSVGKVLSLCIRKLHETLLNPALEISSLLTDKERNHLAMAYYRSAYKVNVQQGESVASLRHIEGQVDWSFKPSGFLPSTMSSGLTSLIPTFSAGAKTSKDWNKQGSSTITLPDYDEDKAEEDIVHLIKMLAKPRRIPTKGQEFRIKLAFIFDEMDKMEVKEQKDLTNELKNLFLERNTIFMLVTSKEFYDLWWDERDVEDAVLASYFSCIKMVPLFTYKETSLLLKRLLRIGSLVLTDEEEEFLTTFALYLTYRARGVPRDIIRELQAIQQWARKGSQAFITDQMDQYPPILAYAEIQRALEGSLDISNTSNTPQQSSEANRTNSNPDPNVSTDPVRIETGYAWLQEGRYEQIRRGLYVLVEKLLDVETCEMNPEAELFKDIRDKSFKRISSPEFGSLFNRLVKRLQSVQLRIGPGSSLARYYTPVQLQQLGITGTDATFFSSGSPATSGSFQKFSVAPLVYTLTGRSIVTTATPSQQDGGDISEQSIEEYLKKDGQVLPQIGLDALKQKAKPFSEDINRLLCRIFLSGQSTKLRTDAAALLQGTVLFDALRDGNMNREQLNHFIASEVNERLLQEFLRLVQSGVDGEAGNRSEGTAMVLRLLERYKPTSLQQVELYTDTFASPTPVLSESIRIDATSTLAKIADSDVLEQVVACLNPRQDIPDALLSSLQVLEAKWGHNLIELLVTSNFTGVSAATIRRMLRGKVYSQLMQLWNNLLAYKAQAMAQRVLVSIMQQRRALSQTDSGENSVLAWLNGLNWDENDRLIVGNAIDENPDLRVLLERVIDKDKQYKIPSVTSKLPPVSVEAPPVVPPQPPLQASQPPSTSRGNGWLTTLPAIVMIAVYYALPTIDLPAHATLAYQLIARLLEMGWLYCGTGALVSLLILLIDLFIYKDSDRQIVLWIYFFISIILLGAGAYLFYLQVSKYPLVVTGWGQTILVVLLIGIIAVPPLIWQFARIPASRQAQV
jgi:hypothetical protein